MKQTQVNEGPFDFLRGAAAETSHKISNSAIARTGRDIVQAGSVASTSAEISKLVAILGKLLGPELTAPTLTDVIPEPNVVPTNKKVQAARNTVAHAMSAPSKYQSNHGYTQGRFQFGEFMQAVYSGQQLDEGAWDFIKGAAGHASELVKDKISAYANKPSALKDIYQAGQRRSQLADTQKQRANQQLQVVQRRNQITATTNQLLNLLNKLSPEARSKAMVAALRKLPTAQQQPLWKRIKDAADANGVTFQQLQ